MEQMRYDDGAMLVRRIPGDGHCLFAALTAQYYGLEVGSREHTAKVWQLRKQVVRHIRDNLEEFRISLEDTTSEMHNLGNNTEEKIDSFLRRLEGTNLWGGQETIAAAASIFNRRIDVYYEQDPIIQFNRCAAAAGVLRIAYRSAGRNALG
ncbi:deubiquitinase OTUD6B-like [Wyeomyia smithii]|uniref:deubiquitinase OTUD6B-like n=1 Tax=Wyeomyia smithii TaxID=174621 RepID=UPI002467CD64|nr:deubiquitinase OTUD6B-like [Wyeomyia smithii]